MTQRLAGKSVLITGAGGGQGRAGAVLFANEGANLSLCDIDDDGLAETVALVARMNPTSRVLAQHVDMRDLDQVESFVLSAADMYGSIDVLYSNAGVNFRLPIAETTEADWDRVHAINLKAAFFLVQYALPALKKSGDASVINIASTAAMQAPTDGNSLYCASKGGLVALTRSQARDLAPFGIRVNCILPGPIETPMLTKAFDTRPEEQRTAVRESVASRAFLKRFGAANEVASLAVFLATADASYMTAAVIPVDGGWLAS